MAFAFIRAASGAFRKAFKDTFVRTGVSGLGTATDGSVWDATAVRGTWSIISNRATGNDANYPMAAVDMGTADVNVSIKSALQGTAAALWVTNSGNWWAVGIDQTQATCNCQTCSTYTAGNYVAGNYVAATYTPGNTNSGNYVAGNYVAGNTICTYYQNSNGACVIA